MEKLKVLIREVYQENQSQPANVFTDLLVKRAGDDLAPDQSADCPRLA